ncbi:hypothetical protein AGDE_16771 [Angomonas deanei]|uniref:Uncharacterized protein n=1 Tax=Angomonas deanei TaxID=59799 RepID=A0A7G2CQN0_9TRYP|nr:hypothetical protein AGDE_16771 [Angomonas deanei]CAD2221301.1 hypothetical protein, conserved [Angomonas deanei]|eukprot:EPY16238.1 hypothetical protein AGDE_16771 [Angomonas deanei]
MTAMRNLQKKASQNVYFHVVALDEVEYTGQGKEHVLAELSKLSFQTNPREYGFENHFLILVYISNHKDLVHVPSQLLTFLSFRTYTAAELKQICQRIVHHAVQQYEAEFGRKEGALYNLLQENGTRHQKGSRAVKKLPKIEISSTLMSLMCKKCEQLYSCDVRQLASMTRRVVYTAYKAKLTEVLSNTNAKGRSVAGKRNPSTAEQTLQQVVENYANNNNNSPVDSTRSSATIGSAARLSTDSAQSAARTAPPTFVATLTNSAQHIDPCGEEQALERIHELPEEAIVVLSCILVRAHKQQQQRQMLAKKPVGPLSATYKDVHQLYCHYKSSQYLPIPSKGSFANSICCLVELQVITGPTDHGQSGKRKKHETPREEATLTFKNTSHPETVEQY